jgi:PAS domain S-box-containing protein
MSHQTKNEELVNMQNHETIEKKETRELTNTNEMLKAEIAHRKQAEATTKKTLSLLNAALESTADGILVIDKEGTITSYNRKYATMWNIPDSVLESPKRRTIAEYIKRELKDPEGYTARVKELTSHPERESYDMLELNDGRIFERYSKPQKIGDIVVGRVWNFRDVTDRIQAEEKLLASLRDKEVMLREIHHRVKNNLQIISGLLDMTRKRSQDPATSGILMDMMMKIDTMAQIHTRLYESKQFNRINMNTQIRDQIAALSNIYSTKDCEISTTIESSSIYLSVDQAIPCALMMNEILTNAYKHAFKGRKSGSIIISAIQEDGNMKITIRDDGIGIGKDLDIIHTNSLGFKLIRALIQYQLKGSFIINNNNGTEVVVKFPIQIVSI